MRRAVARSSATGAGGTKHDADTLSITCLAGVLSGGVSWPEEAAIVTLTMTAPYAGLSGKWMVTGKTLGATQKANGTMTFKLQRWCNVSL